MRCLLAKLSFAYSFTSHTALRFSFFATLRSILYIYVDCILINKSKMYIWSIFDTATGTRSKINSATLKPNETKWKKKKKKRNIQKKRIENQSHVLIDQWISVYVCAVRCYAACNVHINTMLKPWKYINSDGWQVQCKMNLYRKMRWATCWLAGVCDKITGKQETNPKPKRKHTPSNTRICTGLLA